LTFAAAMAGGAELAINPTLRNPQSTATLLQRADNLAHATNG